ncbi:aromatase/cyclase [Streptomyces sp. I05A-00742]|uniref:aromatase/cyclase n=1 Tax=Streptomyces sp. I05A-00742 TaxID=2732853 RepID=UPI001488F64F|nr:aromatase/cyclase [Streptomyces sp. I05A-00742]
MTEPGTREAEHEITVDAPAADVFTLLADVENWPLLFPPTVHAERVERVGASERIRLWATANGTAKTWTSLRLLDPSRRRIEFRQEVSAAPVAAMGGTWLIEPLSPARSRVRLSHHYRAVDDDPEGLAWIEAAVERNSGSELAALKDRAEAATGTPSGLTLSFEDSVRIDGEAKDVYDFLDRADRWPDRLPHVARTEVTEDTPGLQLLRMDTRAPDGSTHTTESVRVCFPHRLIVYKQTALPALMTLHTGRWLLAEDVSGVTATSRHTVVLAPGNITRILGADAGIPEAGAYVRNALSANSRATLDRAKEYAEGRR